MGAWGVGIFEDDTSLDWIEEEYSHAGAEAVRAALQAVVEGEAGDYIDSDTGLPALAAAEAVALAFGAPNPSFGADHTETLGEHGDQLTEQDDLPGLALIALARVGAEGSEIYELWSETGSEEWEIALADLTARLEGVK